MQSTTATHISAAETEPMAMPSGYFFFTLKLAVEGAVVNWVLSIAPLLMLLEKCSALSAPLDEV